MERRHFLRLSGAALAGGLTATRAAAQPGSPTRQALVWDGMGEIRTSYPPRLLGEILDSGMNGVTVTLCDPKVQEEAAFRAVLECIEQHDRFIARHPDLLLKATSTSDLDEARRGKRLALFYLTQNSTHIGRDPDRVDLFYSLGQRVFQLTYNHQNWVGAGCLERTGAGLTRFGLELIEKLNRAGMLIDLSHANRATMADAIQFSKAPPHISHTACMSVHEHVRNTTDENLRALAGKGGVVGICQIRPFLTARKSDNLDEYFRHLEHALNVAGVEHVAIGSDRDHRRIRLTPEYKEEVRSEVGPAFNDDDWPYVIAELNGPGRMEVIWDGLAKRGHPEAAIEKVMGLNLYRLYKEVIG